MLDLVLIVLIAFFNFIFEIEFFLISSFNILFSISSFDSRFIKDKTYLFFIFIFLYYEDNLTS